MTGGEIIGGALSEIRRVGIVGLGLIGGSFALSLKNNSNFTIVGYDLNESVAAQAMELCAVDSVGIGEVCSCDLIVVALSPNAVVSWVRENAAHIKPNTIVTDVCGVKRKLTAECDELCVKNGLRFVGGHPMAGKEKGGFQNAESTLFLGASYILTPTDKTDLAALEAVGEVAMLLGCYKVTIASPEEHDRMIAFTSQLPHVLSGAYILSPQSENHFGYSAGSFRDVSRVAAVDEGLWAELFLYNKDFLSDEIGLLIENLENMKNAIDSADHDKVYEIIKNGRIRKEKVKEATSCRTKK